MIVDPRTIARTALDVAHELASGDDPAARRLAFDFVATFDRATPEERPTLVEETPAPCGDSRFDALLAAIVEHVCSRAGLDPPAWVEEAHRFLGTWWFVSGLRTLHATALVDSPISFARRGVFICDGALSYA